MGNEAVFKWHDVVVVTGMTGTGKSEFLRWYAGQVPRPFFFDVMGEFTEFKNRYQPETDDPAELDAVAEKLWNIGNVTLFVEESEIYLPNTLKVPASTFKIITRGRDRPQHPGVGLVVCTRRIACLNKTVFSLAKHIVFYRTFGVNDIRYISDFYPGADALRTLPDYHYITYHWTGATRHPPLPWPPQPTKK